MKRFFKIIFGLLGAIVILLVAAAFLLPVIYDKEDLKQSIASQFKERTGRQLTINGDLDFTVFPWLAVQVADLSVNNAQGFGDQPFASIEQARVGVALIPLFSKQIVVDEITLDGLDLALEVDKQGRSNWADFSQEDQGPGAADEESMFSSQEVAGLRISNANISYRDAQAEMNYRLSDFSMQTGALGSGQPLPLEISALLEDLAADSRYDFSLSAEADFDVDAEQYRFNDVELDLSDPEQADRAPISLQTAAMSVDLAKETLVMDSFTASISKLKLQGSVTAKNILDVPAFQGSIKSESFSIADLMEDMAVEPLVTADPKALSKARFSADFSGSGETVELKPLNLALDESTIDGSLSLRAGSTPQIRFEFDVDRLNVDRYMAPATEAEEDVAIPSEEIQDVDVNGTLHIAAMTLAGLSFNDADLGVRVDNGKLRLHPLTAKFYGGTYNGDVSLDSSGAAPVISLNEKLDAVIFQQLVGDLVDKESLSGMALGHIQLTGSGTTGSQVLRSLNGDVGLTLTEGALEGINIWYEIRRAYSLYKGLPGPESEPNRTVFSKMKLAASVRDGVINTRELVGELPFLTLRGNGAIDLAGSTVDLGLVAAVRDVPELSADPLTADLGGKQFPFRISGPLDDPGVTVDWGELLKSEATSMLINKLIGDDKDDTENRAEDGGQDGEAEEGEEEGEEVESNEDKAVNTLFKMLKKKDKDKDKDEDEDEDVEGD